MDQGFHPSFVKSLDSPPNRWFPYIRMLKNTNALACFAASTNASAHTSAAAGYWHASNPAFAVKFANKRFSQRLDRSNT